MNRKELFFNHISLVRKARTEVMRIVPKALELFTMTEEDIKKFKEIREKVAKSLEDFLSTLDKRELNRTFVVISSPPWMNYIPPPHKIKDRPELIRKDIKFFLWYLKVYGK